MTVMRFYSGWLYYFGLLLQQVRTQSNDYGVFSFPVTSSIGSYNVLDTLNTSWTTKSNSFTEPYLMLWVGAYPQILVYNQSMETNTSALVPLDFGNAYNNSNFVLQQGGILNIGAPFYISGSFVIRNERSQEPVTYNLGHSTPSTMTTATSTTLSTTLSTITSSPTAAGPSTSSSPAADLAHDSTSNSGLIGGLTALAVLLFALVLGVIIWLWRPKRAQRSPSQPLNKLPSMSIAQGYASTSYAAHEAPETPGLLGIPSKRLLGFFGSQWRLRSHVQKWRGVLSELHTQERYEMPVEDRGNGDKRSKSTVMVVTETSEEGGQ